jgi:hypothetical protein
MNYCFHKASQSTCEADFEERVMTLAKLNDFAPVDLEAHRTTRDLSEAVENCVQHNIREITPDAAALILTRNGEMDYLICKTTQSYADSMSARAWIYNAQPILFDTDGKLLDGRKRLMAAVRSGETLRTLVVTGIKRDTVHTLDQHRRRSYAGVLEARGVKFAGATIRAMAKLIRIERGTFGKPSDPISWARYDQVLDLNSAISEAVLMSENTRGCPLHSTARPVVAFMAIQAGMKDTALELFRRMSDHEFLDRGHPAKELALQLQHDRKRNIKPEVDEMVVMGIQALNDMIDGVSTESPYGWARDFGDCHVSEEGTPSCRKSFMEDTPDNLGMPTLKGYKGLNLGAKIADAKSIMLKTLRDKGDSVPANADLRLVLLTPRVAAAWLERFNKSNRKIQTPHVNSIARDIRGGNWMMNAQPIAFSGDPSTGNANLLNGQHRLEAVVKADCPIEVMIATGLDDAAFATFDLHARHSHRKYIAKGDERVLAAAAKLQWRVDNGKAPGDRGVPSASEIQATIEAHPELMDAFPVSRKKEMQEIGSSGILTFFIASIRRQDDQLSEVYLEQLMSGEDLRKGNPLIKTRAKLIGQRGSLTRRNVLDLLMDTWDEYRAHVDVRGISSVVGNLREPIRHF